MVYSSSVEALLRVYTVMTQLNTQKNMLLDVNGANRVIIKSDLPLVGISGSEIVSSMSFSMRYHSRIALPTVPQH